MLYALLQIIQRYQALCKSCSDPAWTSHMPVFANYKLTDPAADQRLMT